MIKTIREAWGVPELRRKIVFTLFILILYRIGSVIPVPFVSSELLSQAATYADSSLLSYFNIIAGEAFSKASLFALSISPYITASIVMQLLCVAIPALEKLSKEGGEQGRGKIDKITRYVTVGLALVTAYGYYRYLSVTRGDSGEPLIASVQVFSNAGFNKFFIGFVMIACYCAGASLIMWLGEKISEKGIGNGISIILFINILSSVPNMISTFVFTNTEMRTDRLWLFIILAIGVILFFIAAIAFVIHMTNAERRVKITYAKRVQGRKMLGGQSSDLPIKLNMAGVMPIIFAQSIVSIPSTIALLAPGVEGAEGFSGWWYDFTNKWFSYESWIYMVMFFILIIAFGYFYIAISFDPVEISNNLKKNGGFVRGIRPGKPTSDYIKKITNRITLVGSLFLSVVAIIPILVNIFLSGRLGIVAFGGTSLLIVVGVALETVKELEAQLTTYRRPTGIFKKS